MAERVVLSWSGGKDSALALHELSRSGDYEVAALLTTITEGTERVGMHVVDRTNTIITHDSGTPRDQLAPFWETLTPRGFLGWGKSTQLGSSLGFALGAKLAAQHQRFHHQGGSAGFDNGPAAASVFFLRLLNAFPNPVQQIVALCCQQCRKNRQRKEKEST